jgi:hypothetical protein
MTWKSFEYNKGNMRGFLLRSYTVTWQPQFFLVDSILGVLRIYPGKQAPGLVNFKRR